MASVIVAGVGGVPYGKWPAYTLHDLCAAAGHRALRDAGIGAERVQALFVGNFAASRLNHQNHIGALAASAMGIPLVPSAHFEAACASGGLAVRHAALSILSGQFDVVLVMGVEKMSDRSTAEVTGVLAEAGDMVSEGPPGMTFPGVFGMIARRHMHEFGTTRADLTAVAVKNHANGVRNPNAQFRRAVSAAEVSECPVLIADPLNKYDCSPISDGAMALVLVSEGAASRLGIARRVAITGLGQGAGNLGILDAKSFVQFPAATAAARAAFESSGLGPRDIEVAEVHDCFTMAEILAIEDLGFVPKGEGGRATSSGYTCRDGRLPVNLSGGLKAKGHPVGATGVGQILELTRLLRGDSPLVDQARFRTALAHNMGGAGATVVVHILQRVG